MMRAKNATPTVHGYEHLRNWHVVASRADAMEDGEFVGPWESVVILEAEEHTPDGRVFLREVASFAATDYAMALAMRVAAMLNG